MTPEKISRAIVALVSYGHPKMVQISYLETFSAGKSGTSGFRAGCSRIGLPDLAATSKIGRKLGSSRQGPVALVGSCKAFGFPFTQMRSAPFNHPSVFSLRSPPINSADP